MAEDLIIAIFWSDKAVANSLTIKEYLQNKFSQKEIDNFYRMLEAFERSL